jgi:hypothetical protein
VLGFERTRKTFWTRGRKHTVDFIHFHRSGSSYGAPHSASVDIRVHVGIRVLNDNTEAPALNGPFSDVGRLRAGRYHLRFNAKSWSTFDRCVDDLERFVREEGEPWLKRFSAETTLLSATDSPLGEAEREFLRASIAGGVVNEHVDLSHKLLGIKHVQSQHAG